MPDHEIYKFLKDNGLTQKDEKAFMQEYSDPKKVSELHKFFVDNKLTTKSADQFYTDYFSPGKQTPVGSGAPTGRQQPESPNGLDQPQTGSKVPGLSFVWDKPSEMERVNVVEEGRPQTPKSAAKPTPVIAGDITGVYTEQIVQPNALKEANEWARRKKLQASGIENYVPSKSQNIDVEKLVSKATKEGTPTLSIESANANEALRAVEDDYLDFLYKTNPEKAQYESNRVQAIRQKIKEGDSINTEEQKILRNFTREAIEARNAKAEYDILSVRQSSDVDTFQKTSTILMDQLQKGKKEFEALNLDPQGNNPPNKIAAAQKIIERQNNIVEQINNLRGATGFTEEKEDVLYNSARSMTTPEVSEYVTGKFPELKEKEEKIKQQKADEYLSQMQGGGGIVDPFGLGKKALGAAKGFSGAVGNAVIGIAQVPKVLGDFVGDNDYDWVDELYNSTESFLQSKEGRFGRPELEGSEYSELPLSYRMSRLFGEATGSVAVFAVGGLTGGATKAGQFLATTGTAFLTGEADAYKEALAAGMNPKEAAQAGTAVNTVTALIEGMVPDVKYFEPAPFRKSIMAAIRSGKTTPEAIKGAILALPESTKAYLKTATKEGGEEFLGQLGSDVTKETINTMVKNDYQNVWDKDAYFESVLGGFMAGGGMQVFSRPNQKSPVQEDVLLSSVERKQEINDLLNQTDPEKATEVSELLDTTAEIYDGLKNAPSFDALPREKQAHVLSELQRKAQLEESQKAIGVEDSQITEQVKQIDENVKSILDTGFTPAELEQQKIEEEDRKLQAQPETLTEAEIAIKQYLGEKVYTAEDVDSMIEKDEVIEECPPGYVKAEHGIKTGFKPGGKWELVTEFKGKTHEQGGIDIEISEGKIKYSDEDGGMKLRKGGFFSIIGDAGKLIADLAIGEIAPNAIKASDYDNTFFANTSVGIEGFSDQSPLAKLTSGIRKDTMEERTAGMEQAQVDIYNRAAGISKPVTKGVETVLGTAFPVLGAGFAVANAMNKNSGELSLPDQEVELPPAPVPGLTAQQQATQSVINEVGAINDPMTQTVNINGITYGFMNGQLVPMT